MSQLTAEQRRAYIAGGGVYCPFCETNDISGGFVEIDTTGASQRVDCQSCGRHWFDLYRLEDLLLDAEIHEQCDRLAKSLAG